MGKENDILGDKMKAFEVPSTSRKAFKGQPIIVRLDGKSFHTFTRGLNRPYDINLSNLMIETTKFLVEKYHAKLGYVQSDEISILFYEESSSKSQYIFDGRFQKLESLLAAAASVYFNALLPTYIPSKKDQSPMFDARAFVVPTLEDAYECFLWRQLDATKNAVSMAAQSMFSHKSLQGKHSNEMQEMMFSEKGVNFNDYPFFFKRGTFVRRVTKEVTLTEDQLIKIPEKYRDNAKTCIRSIVESFDMWLKKRPEQEDYEEFMGYVK